MNWRLLGNCADADPELFFPEGLRGTKRTTREGAAKDRCFGCIVRLSCLNQGWSEEFGVWGGMTSEERQAAKEGGEAA